MAATQTFTKADVGLGNVDNTADADKAISIAAQAALDSKASQADLTILTTSVAGKAEQAQVTTLDANLTALTTNVTAKADQTAVDSVTASVSALTTTVAGKAQTVHTHVPADITGLLAYVAQAAKDALKPKVTNTVTATANGFTVDPVFTETNGYNTTSLVMSVHYKLTSEDDSAYLQVTDMFYTTGSFNYTTSQIGLNTGDSVDVRIRLLDNNSPIALLSQDVQTITIL